ncbi:MarR family transcriptional regulator [uncultured Vagococcus sp.]|uniref:MarR family winged helix-turn-helix transcriptional regulator n=1 Tax=uncultured Vagococcus sp. TaxID=189676 RepID=UPI0028D54629|nr:MarR family transcriptional regulator [uncultured Vagococcus sp.]
MDVLREIGTIARTLDAISNIEFKEYSLTKGQYLYLVRICENPGIIQDKLADNLKVDSSTAARAIKKLEKNGFIKKVQPLDNKKNKELFPTDKGKQVCQFIIKEHLYSESVALSGFATDEVTQLLSMLQRVQTNIESDWYSVKKGNKRNY